MKRAALYIRVSSKPQLDGYSLDVQMDAAIRFVTDRGWQLVDVYRDEAESARTANRRNFQRLLSDLPRLGLDYLLVHSSDRFARSMFDHYATKEILKQYGARLIFITEDFPDNPEGQLAEGMKAAYNEYYSNRISFFVKKSLDYKVRAGMWPTYAPVGYINTRRARGIRESEGVIEVDPMQAPLMRETLERYSTGQYSINTLLALMTKKGLISKNGKPLSPSNLHYLLMNPVYKGMIPWHGEVFPGEHPALVSVEVWDRVQEVLRQHANGEIRVRLEPHYLRGSLFCDLCGSRMSDHFAKRRAHRYFFCLGRHRRRIDCDQPYTPTHEIEPQVEERWGTVKLTESRKRELRHWIREVVAANVADPSQQEAARVRLHEINEERARAARMAVKGALPEDLFMAELARIGQETESLQKILEGDPVLAEGPEIQERMFAMVEKLPGAYAEAKPDIERRGLNQAVFAGFWIAGREVRRHQLQPPYADLLEADLPDPARSNRDYLAGEEGFEPSIS